MFMKIVVLTLIKSILPRFQQLIGVKLVCLHLLRMYLFNACKVCNNYSAGCHSSLSKPNTLFIIASIPSFLPLRAKLDLLERKQANSN